MTILQVAGSSRLGGVETYLLRLAPHLRQVGHRVIFVTREGTPLAHEARTLGFETHEWFRGGKNPVTVYRLARLMRHERVDVVHTHIFSANSLGALAAKLAGIPSVARVPATESVEHYRKSTYVYAVSRNVARYLEKQGFPAEKLRVFYNGVDWHRFEMLPDKDEARKSWRVPADAYVVCCAASLTARKGQRFLLEAVATLPPGTHLLLCGEGKEETALRQKAVELGLDERVHFLGFQSDIRPALAASDVFVLPSLHEGLPNVVLEALAAGLPTVATAIAGTPEIIEDGVNGFLVPAGEVEPIAAALDKLRTDADLQQHFREAGRLTVQTRFDGHKCLVEVQQFLEEVVAAWKNNRTLVAAPQRSESA